MDGRQSCQVPKRLWFWVKPSMYALGDLATLMKGKKTLRQIRRSR
jgi:hypothetical protein